MLIDEEAYLAHYGIIRRSGRYPWGSGGNTVTRSKDFIAYADEMRKKGLSESQIAKGVGMTTTELRATRSIARNAARQADIAFAHRLKEKGYSNVAIGERMGVPESTVRNLIAPGAKDKADILQNTAKMLREQVESKGMIDVGTGVESYHGISSTKLSTAVAILKDEGYELHHLKVQQVGTGKYTEMKVLAKEGTSWGDAMRNRASIRQIDEFTEDGGRSYLGLTDPLSIDSKRVQVVYAEDGGAQADGVIYIRPGVEDVSIGNARYAQVRVAVDGTHYLKGMAVYKDDLPDGIDISFNTNKSDTGNKLEAMKKMSDDPDNPFGAQIKRQTIDPSTKKAISSMNIVNEEGDWESWSKNLSSQMLSKQDPRLAKSQLDMTYESRKEELDGILALTNPAVKRKLLEAYSDSVDSAAVHLKAAPLSRQGSHVILPVSALKETEVYAPNYKNGERVALVRYPHGGTFEIPELIVNNNNPSAKKILGQAKDAIGINSKVAERLSGADFDGDTVLVIPNDSGRVKSTKPLDGLKNFDPQSAYKGYEGMPKMSSRTKQIEMGIVSNLITDMTIRGASSDELARAVRHSMVVIDAEKHNLDYRRSAQENAIASLKTKYQGGARAGAATIVSRASSTVRVEDRKLRSAGKGGAIDLETGRLMYEPTGAVTKNRKGETVPKTIKSKRLAETDDARTLIGDPTSRMERIYADHSNKLKGLANKARLEIVATKNTPYSPSAKVAYQKEVDSLNSKLRVAIQNRPRERQAQVIANATVSAKRKDNPDMDEDRVKKIKSQALAEARSRTGAKKDIIVPTPREWEAIQAGAISNNKLTQILNNSDLDQIKALATPRQPTVMTSTKLNRAKAMLNSGYTQGEIADALGVALSTLKSSLE